MTVHATLSAPPPAPRPLRRALLIGCALAGLGAAGWMDRLEAQAFNANPKTSAGVVTYDRATPTVETVTIETPTAIINWFPSGGIFLPFGNTATFTNGINTPDFVVLNRILTAQPIRFDGRVVSILQDPAIGTSAPGGTIIFSSPGGIIIGSTAVFDVGNLVLTSLNVIDDGTGNFYDPATQGLQFQGGLGIPPAGVFTEPGAQINALSQGSYVAIVAPQIVHAGSIRVNGSAAFIAGNRVQMRVNQGLFDIIVDVGTDNVTPLVHTGSTGGPASTGAGDTHRIYLVAVPRNQAITAILSGNAGFDPAINAFVENGAIVLSAGFNIVGGEPDRFGQQSPPPVPGVGASFEIRGGNYSSDLFGYAVTDMLAGSAISANLNFAQDVSLFAGRRAHLFAGGGNQSVTVGGNALVSTARTDSADGASIDHQGGESLIFASKGGTVTILGDATVDASARGEVDAVQSRAGNGTGGTAGVFADGGTVQVNGNLRVLATGQGGVLDLFPNQGGAGTGGTAFVEGRNGGGVGVGVNLFMDVRGAGSRASGLVPIPAAIGSGGDIIVAAIGGGGVNVAGATNLLAGGTGGEVLPGAVVTGGTGQGGTITIASSGNVTLQGNTTLNADATGGTGPTNGNAQGGTLTLAASAFAGPGGNVGGTLNAGAVTGSASAAGAPGTGNSPGDWHVRAVEGSTINLVNLALTAAATGAPAVRPFSSLEALNGTINVTQVAALTTAGEIRVTAAAAGRVTGGRFTLAAGEDVTITHAGAPAGAVTVDVADLIVTAGDDFTLGAGATTRTANQTDVRAADLATVAGRMLGRDILIGSSDIDIQPTGAIGDAGTQLVSLTVNPTTQFALLGGGAQGPGYTLTNAEAGRIRAGTLRVTAPALAGNPAMIVRDLTLAGGGAATGIGILDLVTPGIARIEGALLMNGARAIDGIAINAGQRLELVTPAGSVRVRDGAGAPGGTLTLTSNNIWIASQAIIDQLRLDPNYAGRDDDLIDNDGVDAPRGYVEAGAVTLATGGTLFAQNSTAARGTFASGSDFGGITVGAGGLTVRSTATPATVTAFGRRLNADGSFTTGDAFFFATNFNAGGAPLATGFTAQSALNTCIIVTGQCPLRPPPTFGPGGPDPITGPTGGSSAIQLPGMADEDDLVDTSFSADPLIEEPVTSGGESSLWECDRDGDGDCDDQDN